jgi:glycerophosphoryl diester phosphodiesterase
MRRALVAGLTAALVASVCSNAHAVTGSPERWVIAHRGGAAVYPEEGSRGYDHATASGFALETDVRALADGTLVLLHDATVDRTMTGVRGPVSSLTLAQWRAARLKAAPSGIGAGDRPVTLDDFLTRYGGKVPLLIERKAGDATKLVNAIKARGPAVAGSVLLQTFDFATANAFEAAGLDAMLLMTTEWPTSLATIKAAGIRYVGVSRDMGPWHVSELRRQGFVVVSWTVNAESGFNYEVNQGVNGVFSDNPWRLS